MSFRRMKLLAAALIVVSWLPPRNVVAFAPSPPLSQAHIRTIDLRDARPPRYADGPFGDVINRAAVRRQPSTYLSLRAAPDVLPDLPSVISAVETFDGSTVDPVVVSNVFWGALQWKIISVIIGQILAAAAFAVLSSVAASQLSKLGDYVRENVFKEEARTAAGNTVAQFASTVVEKGKSPTVEPDFGKLLICIIIDTIGTSSELLPIVGELTDIVWAPLAGLGLRSLFQSNVLFALEFTEEILPLTDILPLATLCWVVETYFGDSGLARALQIGQYGNGRSGTVIDVPGDDVVPERKLLKDAIDVTAERNRK